jgi:hypothetical protein
VARGKKRWGEKTPFHSRHIAQMAAVFPDAVFIGIVRHPGAVVHSLTRKFHYTVADAVAYWDATNKEILRRGLELGEDRFALLRYEDLVEHPEQTLRELTDFLAEPWSDDLLRHNDVQAAQGAPQVSAGGTRTRDAISADLAHRWAQELSAMDRELLAAGAGPLARFLGYDPVAPGAPGPFVPPNPDGRVRLLTGATLAERQRGEGAVALEEAPAAVVMPDMSPAELAKRLQVAEAALARVRSSRAVRWTHAGRRIQRRVTGLPAELLAMANHAVRSGGRSRSDG